MSAGKVEESLCFLLQAPLFLSPSFFFLPILWIGDQEVQLLQLPATSMEGSQYPQDSPLSSCTGLGRHPWTVSLDCILRPHP